MDPKRQTMIADAIDDPCAHLHEQQHYDCHVGRRDHDVGQVALHPHVERRVLGGGAHGHGHKEGGVKPARTARQQKQQARLTQLSDTQGIWIQGAGILDVQIKK